MIVDFHTHVFPPEFRESREEHARRDRTFEALFSDPRARLATTEELVEALDRAQVDLAVIMGIGWTDRGMSAEANNYIIGSVSRFPGRLLGFCSVNPAWGEAAVAEIERCARAGVKGVGELHPDTQGFDLTNRELMAPMMDAARALGLVVLVHSSEPVGHLYPGKGKTTPDKLYAFARNFPENTIVCAHWGGGLPFYYLMPEVPAELENVYYDTAASPFLYVPEVFPTASGLIGADKILFGTDFPLIGHSRMLKQVQEAPIEEDDRERILGRNARTLLGIE